MVTFNQFCETFNVKAHEREPLAWHLAQLRARLTYEALTSLSDLRATRR